MKLLYIPIVIASLGLAGCTATIDAMLTQIGAEPGTASAIESKVIGQAVKPVPIYCEAPLFTREDFRANVNTHPNMRGHKIAIWCEGDPPVTLEASAAPEVAPVPEPAPEPAPE